MGESLGGDYIADLGTKSRAFKSLEGNVVFHIVELAGGLLLRRPRIAAGFRFTARPRFTTPGSGIVARRAPALPAAEHLHDVAADVGGIPILAVLVLPLARAQAALDIDLRAFLQVFAGHLGQ